MSATKSDAYIGKVASNGRVNTYNFISGKTDEDPIDPGNPTDPEEPTDPVEPGWKKFKSFTWETSHPMKSWTKDHMDIKIPGAKKIMVLFEKIDMGRNSNSIRLFDSSGRLQQTIKRKHENLKTNVVEGLSLIHI